jgi:hypothetical protein
MYIEICPNILQNAATNNSQSRKPKLIIRDSRVKWLHAQSLHLSWHVYNRNPKFSSSNLISTLNDKQKKRTLKKCKKKQRIFSKVACYLNYFHKLKQDNYRQCLKLNSNVKQDKTISTKTQCAKLRKRTGREREREREREYRRESIAGVGNKHTSFANSTVADSHALNEPGRAHFNRPISSLTTTSSSSSMPLIPPLPLFSPIRTWSR